MGTVYRAWDPELEREVAIKSISILPGESGAPQEEARERFFREARAAARLVHPGIAAVYDVIREGDNAYIVMELVRGANLIQALEGGAIPDPSTANRIIRDAAIALDAAHAAGIVHRDVKPGNILLTDDGKVKIVDFGVAKLPSSETLTQAGVSVGTLRYMSPEQVKGEPVDGRADQYSLAVVAYQLALRSLPFEADTWVALSYKIITAEPAKASELIAAMGPAAGGAVLRAMSKSPDQRYASCSEFAAALSGSGVPAGPPAAARRAALPRWMAFTGVFVAIAASLVVVFLSQSNKKARPAESSSITQPSATAVPSQAATATIPLPEKAAAGTQPPAAAVETQVGAIEFVDVKPGRFFMGSDTDQDHERPRHPVQITRPFQMGKFEVTRRQWAAVMGGSKPADGEAELPAINVTFAAAQSFVAKLSAAGDGFRYRLPSEAEWEYAARAGGSQEPRNLEDFAWYSENSFGKLRPVGERQPNAWGLHDMLGNAWEWVGDWYDAEYYAASPAKDPSGPGSGEYRILRGGSFSTQGMMLRFAYRHGIAPAERFEEAGLRVVRERRP